MPGAAEIIDAKRRGGQNSREEIRRLISGLLDGRVTEAQMAAWLMAVCIRGMDAEETYALTDAMVSSGATLDLSALPGRKVDKHSTGGVGDKVTLVAAPLAASCGVVVPKMSGRALGHTGGTLDKIESIPGMRVDLSPERFVEQVSAIGLAVAGQGPELVPADGRIYALRDQTATVRSVPLIASSVMSKKLAAGADAFVIEITVGTGAFMRTIEEGRALAETMRRIARSSGRELVAVLIGMDEPLGRAVGNALEVREAIEVLSGRGPSDVREVSLEMASHMMVLGERAATLEEARQQLAASLDGGVALAKFREWVLAQGGDQRVFDEPSLLPVAGVSCDYTAPSDGYLYFPDVSVVGEAASALGAGLEEAGAVADPGAGIVFAKKTGDPVVRGETVAVLHTSATERLERARGLLEKGVGVSEEPAEVDRILGVID